MIWAAISWNVKPELAFMRAGKRTATDYVDVVYNGPLLPMLSKIDGAILMDDGASIHRSKVPKEWRELHKLEKLDWLAQSPDLNPIENIWKQMKDHVQNRKQRVKNVEEMEVDISESWKAVDIQRVRSLIATFRLRLKAVIKAKGGSTRY